MSFVNRRLYKQKPQAWGPVSEVQASLFKNAESIGIDSKDIALAMPMWGPGNQIDYSQSVSYPNVGATFSKNSLYFYNNEYINIDKSSLISLPETKDFSFLVSCTQVSQSTTFEEYYSVLSWGGTDDLLVYPHDTVALRGMRVFWKDPVLNSYGGFDVEALNKPMTITGSFKVGEQIFCKDGKIIFNTSNALLGAGPFNSLRIGSWADNANQRFRGYINIVLLFSKYLNANISQKLSDNPYFLLHRVPSVFYSVPGGGVLPTFNPLFLNAAQPTRVIQ